MSRDSERARRGGKRERTRAALVKATLDLVGEKGFAAASLDEIARRAGMTKGAIYSNFSSKAELLLAALAARGLGLSSERPRRLTVPAELAAMSSELSDALTHAAGAERLLAEFQLYAMGEPELRRDLAAVYAQSFSGTADYLEGLDGPKPAMPPRRLAVALQAVALGFMIQSFITPDEVTREVIDETLGALARGLTQNES